MPDNIKLFIIFAAVIAAAIVITFFMVKGLNVSPEERAEIDGYIDSMTENFKKLGPTYCLGEKMSFTDNTCWKRKQAINKALYYFEALEQREIEND